MSRPVALIFWSGLAVLAVLLFVTGTMLRLPPGEWSALLLPPDDMSMEQVILAHALLPRAVVALLAGAALGLAGALLQAVLRNPLADASTLGISAGAQLAIVCATLFFPAMLDGNRELVALAGAAAAAVPVFALAARSRFEPVTMIAAGMLTGITAGALSAALTLSQGEYLMSLAIWNGGSLSQQGWASAQMLAIQLALCASVAFFVARPLVTLDLGDATARSLGVPLGAVRFMVALVAVALAAMVASAVGLIGFIGLAAPALVRASGVRRRGSVLLAAPFAGAILLWLGDGLVRFLAQASGETFPTGAVLALAGGPMILLLLSRMRHTVAPATHVPAGTDRAGAFPFLIGLLLLAAILSLFAGKNADGWQWLAGHDLAVLLPFRLPRLVSAAAAGGLLALAGAILQRLTGNPLASPEVLGVSGGAGAGYALALTVFPVAGPLQLLAGASGGAFIVLALVLAFAMARHLPPERLLLAGIAISAFGSSILSALIAIGDQRSWQLLAWLGGSASTATPFSAMTLTGILAASLLAAMAATRWLTIMPLGQAVPQALGLPVRAGRIGLLVVAAMATGAASLLVGPLSFVGLIAPHIVARAGFRRAGSGLAVSALTGAALMAVADFGARTVTFPYELPLGLFASLIGAPCLVWLLARSR